MQQVLWEPLQNINIKKEPQAECRHGCSAEQGPEKPGQREKKKGVELFTFFQF